MNVCLNPFERHQVTLQSGDVPVCPEPHCSYLIEGAELDQWQIKKLLRSSATADLYIAIARDTTRMLVKVAHRCASDALIRLEYLGAVQHPHIFPIQLMGEVEQKHLIYLLSRYEEAGSLARYTNSGTRFSLNSIFRIIEQAASALQFVHSLHLVHGYIKPENVLIVGKKQIQVSDFYHAFQLKNIALEPSIYLAPEQMQGQLVPETDQYALAMIACQLFYTFIQPEVNRSRITQTPFTFQAIEILLTQLPQSVQRVFRQALAPEPERRFNKILDFAFELQKSIGVPTYSNSNLLPSPNRSIPVSMPDITPIPIPMPTPIPTPQSRSVMLPEQPAYPTMTIPRCKLPGHTAAVSHVCWAANGAQLASTSADKSLRLWHIQQKIGTPKATLTSQEGNFTALRWSPDSHYLAAATEQASIRIWKIEPVPALQPTLATSWWGHDGQITALDWSPDGTMIASSGKDRTIRKWNLQGKLLSSWQAHGRGGVTTLAWSPAGDMLASGGSDRLITLWDSESNTQVGGFSAHTDEIRKLCWSPDGKLLSSCAGKKDHLVHLWDPYTHQKIATLDGHEQEVVGVFWSADSRWLLTVSADRTLRCWDLSRSPVVPAGPPMPLDEVPLTMEGAAGTNCIAIGTSGMYILVLQLTNHALH